MKQGVLNKRSKKPKKQLQRKCDAAWQAAVAELYNHRCALKLHKQCLYEGQAGHHMINRDNLRTRWDVRCGIYVCSPCHQIVDNHHDIMRNWLKDNMPMLYDWHEANCQRTQYTPTADELNTTLQSLIDIRKKYEDENRKRHED